MIHVLHRITLDKFSELHIRTWNIANAKLNTCHQCSIFWIWSRTNILSHSCLVDVFGSQDWLVSTNSRKWNIVFEILVGRFRGKGSFWFQIWIISFSLKGWLLKHVPSNCVTTVKVKHDRPSDFLFSIKLDNWRNKAKLTHCFQERRVECRVLSSSS